MLNEPVLVLPPILCLIYKFDNSYTGLFDGPRGREGLKDKLLVTQHLSFVNDFVCLPGFALRGSMHHPIPRGPWK